MFGLAATSFLTSASSPASFGGVPLPVKTSCDQYAFNCDEFFFTTASLNLSRAAEPSFWLIGTAASPLGKDLALPRNNLLMSSSVMVEVGELGWTMTATSAEATDTVRVTRRPIVACLKYFMMAPLKTQSEQQS